MSAGEWKREGRKQRWTYTGHGWGVYSVTGAKGRFYAAHEPFSGPPTIIGTYERRADANAAVENTVARLAESKARKGNPVRRVFYSVENYGSPKVIRETDSVSEAHGYAKETPSSSVAVFKDDGSLVKDLHFSPKHPVPGLAEFRGMVAGSARKYRARLKGNPVRKRRTAAQKAATAKMLAANRARRGKRTRRKAGVNPKPRAKSHRFQIATISATSGGLVWWDGHGFAIPRANGAAYHSAETAMAVARNINRKCAVVGEGEPAENVKAFLTGKK